MLTNIGKLLANIGKVPTNIGKMLKGCSNLFRWRWWPTKYETENHWKTLLLMQRNVTLCFNTSICKILVYDSFSMGVICLCEMLVTTFLSKSQSGKLSNNENAKCVSNNYQKSLLSDLQGQFWGICDIQKKNKQNQERVVLKN